MEVVLLLLAFLLAVGCKFYHMGEARRDAKELTAMGLRRVTLMRGPMGASYVTILSEDQKS